MYFRSDEENHEIVKQCSSLHSFENGSFYFQARGRAAQDPEGPDIPDAFVEFGGTVLWAADDEAEAERVVARLHVRKSSRQYTKVCA